MSESNEKPRPPKKDAVKRLREIYYEQRSKLKPSQELIDLIKKGAAINFAAGIPRLLEPSSTST